MAIVDLSSNQVFQWRYEGHCAQRQGITRECCPYSPASPAWIYWLEGWDDTYDDTIFFDGVEAAVCGQNGNPFTPGTLDHEDWEEGYTEGLESIGKSVTTQKTTQGTTQATDCTQRLS